MKSVYRGFVWLMTFLLMMCFCTQALGASITIKDEDGTTVESTVEIIEETTNSEGAREAFIEDIIALGEELYIAANGRAQRAQYSGDIYVCKNFTVYLFRQNMDQYRIGEYPDVELIIPNNKPKDEMVDYVYGVEWEDNTAEEGNPFYAAATFRYDDDKTMEENQEDARAFLQEVQRGDYFQMAANYYYGIGAHSMIFIEDYDAETDSVHWMDSNMKGETRNDERYGYVQFDAVKDIDWFVDAFCRSKYGATIYRLRDDIIYAQ